MLFSAATRNKIFKIFVFLSLVTALYHAVGIFYTVNDSPVWRHVLFVAINLFCAFGFLKRPRYFVYLFGLLVVQQYYSHGSYMINLWMEKKQVHWISLFDLLLLPVALICLVEAHPRY